MMNDSIADEISQLKALLDSNAITQEEFDRAKCFLINDSSAVSAVSPASPQTGVPLPPTEYSSAKYPSAKRPSTAVLSPVDPPTTPCSQPSGMTQSQPAAPVSSHAYFSLTESWRTSIGFSILGVFCGYILSSFAGYGLGVLLALLLIGTGVAFSLPQIALLLFFGLLGLASFILSIIYPAMIYPSYFDRDRPLLRSSRAISFFNCFFGGFIFGPIWNSNLTNKKKGVSHIVFIVLYVLLIVLAAFQGFLAP